MAQDYARVTPAFWTGSTGRKLRGNVYAQVAAAYLITCRAATPIGIFHLALPTMQHETGLSAARLRSALEALEREGFAYYHPEREEFWVPERAKIQVAPELKPSDNRWRFVQGWLKDVEGSPFADRFRERYADDYQIEPQKTPAAQNSVKPLSTPFEGGSTTPSKPIAVAVAVTVQPNHNHNSADDEPEQVQVSTPTQTTSGQETTTKARRRDAFVDGAWQIFDSVDVKRPSAGLMRRWVKDVFTGDEAWCLRCLDALAVQGALDKPAGYLLAALRGMVTRGEHRELVEPDAPPAFQEVVPSRFFVGQQTLDGGLVYNGREWVGAEQYAAEKRAKAAAAASESEPDEPKGADA